MKNNWSNIKKLDKRYFIGIGVIALAVLIIFGFLNFGQPKITKKKNDDGTKSPEPTSPILVTEPSKKFIKPPEFKNNLEEELIPNKTEPPKKLIEPPEFKNNTVTLTLVEESFDPNKCLMIVHASNPNSHFKEWKVLYRLQNPNSNFMIDSESGCLKLTRKIDFEDKFLIYTTNDLNVIAYYQDLLGKIQKERSSMEIKVEVSNVNDNAPALTKTKIELNDTTAPGSIYNFTATDSDEQSRSEMSFKFEIVNNKTDPLNEKILERFEIRNGNELFTKVQLKYQDVNQYLIPIRVSDNDANPQSRIEIFKVIIQPPDTLFEFEKSYYNFNIFKNSTVDENVGNIELRMSKRMPYGWPDFKIQNNNSDNFALKNKGLWCEIFVIKPLNLTTTQTKFEFTVLASVEDPPKLQNTTRIEINMIN